MTTKFDRLQADLTNTENQLETANATLSSLLESQMSSYEMEDGNTRQDVVLIRIDRIKATIEYLENKRERLYSRINNNGYTRSIKLRR